MEYVIGGSKNQLKDAWQLFNRASKGKPQGELTVSEFANSYGGSVEGNSRVMFFNSSDDTVMMSVRIGKNDAEDLSEKEGAALVKSLKEDLFIKVVTKEEYRENPNVFERPERRPSRPVYGYGNTIVRTSDLDVNGMLEKVLPKLNSETREMVEAFISDYGVEKLEDSIIENLVCCTHAKKEEYDDKLSHIMLMDMKDGGQFGQKINAINKCEEVYIDGIGRAIGKERNDMLSVVEKPMFTVAEFEAERDM